MTAHRGSKTESLAHGPRWPVVWSVAGSDSGAGAGLQADLRAFDAFEVHGCTALASLTAQNSVAVQAMSPISAGWLDAQLAALADDLPPRAIKTGLLGSVENLQALCRWVERLRARGPVPLVVDPVWRASTGAAMADDDLRRAICEELLPLATVVTPNRQEAAWLLGNELPLRDDEVEAAARALQRCGVGSVVITGGDLLAEATADSSTHNLAHATVSRASSQAAQGKARDFVLTPQGAGWMSLPRIDTPHHHGTGCVFASSLAAALAHGFCEADAAVLSKMATARALQHARPAGAGAGAVRPSTEFAQRTDLLPGWQPAGAAATPRMPFAAAEDLGLYAIVDSAAWVERVVQAGVRTVQLRIKSAPAELLSHEVQASIAAAARHGARLYVNDHWQLALRHRAHGVHLGQADLDAANLPALQAAGLRLGVSTHSVWEVARAHALRPSYIACGPVHPTQTKRMPWQSQGAHNLSHWCAVLPMPVVAVGGLDLERAADAVRCGANGIAVLSGITGATRPEAVVRRYLDAIQHATASSGRHDAPLRPRATLGVGQGVPRG